MPLMLSTMASQSLCKKIKKEKYFIMNTAGMSRKFEHIFPFGYLKKMISMSYLTRGDFIKEVGFLNINIKESEKIYEEIFIDYLRYKLKKILRKDDKSKNYAISYEKHSKKFYLVISPITFVRDVAKCIKINPISKRASDFITSNVETYRLEENMLNLRKSHYVDILHKFDHVYQPKEPYIFINLDRIESYITEIVTRSYLRSYNLSVNFIRFLFSVFLFFIDTIHRMITVYATITIKNDQRIKSHSMLGYELELFTISNYKVHIAPYYEEANLKYDTIIEKPIVGDNKEKSITINELLQRLIKLFIRDVLHIAEEDTILGDSLLINALERIMIGALGAYITTYIDVIDRKELVENSRVYAIYFMIEVTSGDSVNLHFEHQDVHGFSLLLRKDANGFLDKIIAMTEYNRNSKFAFRRDIGITKISGDETEDFDFFIERIRQHHNNISIDIKVPFNFNNIIIALQTITDNKEPIDVIYTIAKRMSRTIIKKY